jgi:type VI secretion system protein ImpM
MLTNSAAGFFGKLPAHGDFIHRGLPTRCVNLWDEWLQGVIGASREQLGDSWLDIYLTSPIWRFALSPGVVDESLWAGICLPSVDRVGRYFPFSILSRAPAKLPATVALTDNDPWYESMEQIALQALDGHLLIDEMAEQIARLPLEASAIYTKERTANQQTMQQVVNLDFEEQTASSVYPYLLDAVYTSLSPTYSIWRTRGSDRVEPCVATCPGLPPVASAAAMWTGQWKEWQWQEPYKLIPPAPVHDTP